MLLYFVIYWYSNDAKVSLAAVKKRQAIMHKKYHGGVKNPMYFVWPEKPVEPTEEIPRSESMQCMCEKTGVTEYDAEYVQPNLRPASAHAYIS